MQNLSGLIRLSLTFRVLNIDSRVARPWGFENHMATAALPRLTKIRRAYLFEVVKAYVGGLQTHLFEKFFEVRHINNMVPLLAPFVNPEN